MDIVDAQIHLWQAEAPDRSWPPGRAVEVQKPYPISKETVFFHMGLAGVRRAVLLRRIGWALCIEFAAARHQTAAERMQQPHRGGCAQAHLLPHHKTALSRYRQGR